VFGVLALDGASDWSYDVVFLGASEPDGAPNWNSRTFMLRALTLDRGFGWSGQIIVLWVLAFDGAPNRRGRHITFRAFALDWASSGRHESLGLLFSFEIGDGL
jgi:hypothetical protein